MGTSRHPDGAVTRAATRLGARLGVITPVLTRLPGAHASWEQTAGIDAVVDIARTADRLGYDHLTCSEHVAVPVADAAVRGGTYWDPLATFGLLAGHTSRIRFATYVLVLGYHHPLEIAKRYGTLDRVSGGRVVLGVGVGSLEDEFALLDAPFADRGARADDALRALRAAWGRREVEHHGEHFDYEGLVVDPHAVTTEVPLWVGGRTRRSLRRAITLGTGWAPFWLRAEEMAAMLAEVDLPEGFEVIAQPTTAFDPASDPEAVDEEIARWTAIGATVVEARVVHHSLAHYLEQLEALTP
jgi:probable F420-dependent oxidoreductase